MIRYFIIFFISMTPIIELRGALIYASAMNLNYMLSMIVAIVGNSLPIPFIYFVEKKILHLMIEKNIGKKFAQILLEKGHNAGSKLLKSAGKKGAFIALMLFIGIPIPGTGVYTGILAATLLDIDFKTTFLAGVCGVVMAGVIVLAISHNVFSFLGV